MRYIILMVFLATGCGAADRASQDLAAAEASGPQTQASTSTATGTAAAPAAAPAVAGDHNVVVNVNVNTAETPPKPKAPSPEAHDPNGVGPEPNDAILVEDARDLPLCTRDVAGRLYYVVLRNEFIACEDGEWTSVPLENTETGVARENSH